MRISEYPVYKPSGSKWLGDIHAHWKVRRLKYVAASNFSGVNKHTVDDETPVRLCNYVDVYYNDYITPDIAFMDATATQTEIARFTLKKGDVLVTKDSEAWDDIAIPAYVVSDLQDVLCGYHLAHIRAAIGVFHGEYLFRAFSASGINDQFMVESTGITRYGLGKYGLDNSLFPLPPIEEQYAIAAFLNHETKRIDQLIAKKERQIELLQEKRSALISHAVTKGLNPKAKMKDSGIEWLGEIPEHWDIQRLKYVSSINDEILNEDTEPLFELLYIDIGSVDSVQGIVNKEVMEFEKAPSRARRIVRNGDIIVSTVRTYLRAIAPIVNPESNLIVSTGFAVIRPRYGLESHFATYALRAPYFVDTIVSRSVGVSYPAINASVLTLIEIALPPSEEQRKIALYLAHETKKIDVIVSRVKDSIDKLREYRTALISAAVTGKIDVREEVS